VLGVPWWFLVVTASFVACIFVYWSELYKIV